MSISCRIRKKEVRNNGFQGENEYLKILCGIKMVCLGSRGSITAIRTDAKLRSLTKIDLNVMHLVNLYKYFCQKLQIRDDFQN